LVVVLFSLPPPPPPPPTTGATILRLPRDVGVEARVKTSIGKVVASDFHYDGDAYRNDACGSSAVTLRLIVTASIGKVTLEAGD
jgi:hypothetical protein